MKYFKFFLLIIPILFIACSSNNDDINQTNDEVVNFLNEVIDIMEANSINRNIIDWSDFRRQVLDRASSANSIAQAENALRHALVLLGDNHSFIRKQNGSIIFESDLSCPSSTLNTINTPDNIGYVQVESFSGADQQSVIAFAEGIQEAISSQDNQNITGWIVDLRNNGGGNMWPMLAGIGPILGEGTVGYFIDPDNSITTWSFSNGKAMVNSSTIVQVTDNYELVNPNPKVAVLINKAVNSSGEAIAISFIGRENTMSFGSETCGRSTANSGFNLSDGSTLILTVAYMADRNQNIFGMPIIPDNTVTDEAIIQNAIDYLNN